MKISVIVPAHNEQSFISEGLSCIKNASQLTEHEVEIVVVLNRCTDQTEKIAREFGAIITHEDSKNLSLIRNAGVRASSGDVIVTVDADSQLHPHFLRIIIEKLNQNYIGGGTLIFPERWSLGIILSASTLIPYALKYRVSAGAFWTTRESFEAIGGFNPEYVTIEDVDFALRLKAYGKTKQKKWGTAWTAPLITSCRKFDQFGDWHLIRDRKFLKKVFSGKDQEVANQYWYDQRPS